MPEYVDQQALADRDEKVAKLRRLTDEIKRRRQEELAPEMSAGNPEAKKQYELIGQIQPWDVAYDMARSADEVGNVDLVKQFRDDGDYALRQAQKDQTAAQRDQFEASRGTLAGVTTDVLMPVYRGLDAFARTASFGGSELVKSAARKGVEALGGPSQQQSEMAEAVLGEEAARGGVGKLAAATTETLGVIRGFGRGGPKPSGAFGATDRLVSRGLPQDGAKQTTARLLGGSAGKMVAANAMVQLGEAGAAALNDLLYGESPNRARAMEILKSMPHGALNSAILGASIPVLQRIGLGISSSLAGKWTPGVRAGQALRELPFGQQMAARTAQGFGGTVEFLGFTALPHVSEDGIAIAKPWLDAFSSDPERHANGLVDLFSQLVSGYTLGFSKSRYHGGPENAPEYEGTLLRRKPTLPPEVEIALKKSTREAVMSLMDNADGDRAVMGSLLNAVRAREALGYERPGTWEKLAEQADVDFGAAEKAKRDEAIQGQMETDEKKERQRIDKAAPGDLGYITPGMGMDTPEKAELQGAFPFMAGGKRISPRFAGSWPDNARMPEGLRRSDGPDLSDPGTPIQLNVGSRGAASWIDARVKSVVKYEEGPRAGQVKGVLVETPLGEGMFTGRDIMDGLVRRPGAEETPAERSRQVPGQRKLPFRKPKAAPVLPPAKEAAKADVAASAAVARAKVAPQAPAPATKANLGPALRGAPADRRKAVVPVALERRKSAQQRRELTKAAYTSPLSGLPNKPAFEAAVKNMPGRGRRIVRIDMSNLKAANEPSHENGDRVLKAAADKLRAAAREAGIGERDVFHLEGDAFAVTADPGKLARFRRALASDNLADSTEVSGKKFEHRLIAGEARDTDVEADKSQKRHHDRYKAQAEAAGLGVYRTAHTSQPRSQAESPPPKPKPSVFGGGRRERKSAEAATRVEAARERLKGSGVPPAYLEPGVVRGHVLAADAGKVYDGRWRPVRWADVVAARESGDADRVAYVERAAEIRGVKEPSKELPAPQGGTTGFPSPATPVTQAAPTAAPSSTTPDTPLIKKMGPTDEYVRTLRSEGFPVEKVEREADFIRSELRDAENRGDDAAAAKWLKALDAISRIADRKKGIAQTEAPTRTAVDPEPTTGREIVDRALRVARNEYEITRATNDLYAKQTGKPIPERDRLHVEELKKRISDLEKLSRRVAKKGAGQPSEVTGLPAPDVGENVVVRLASGRAVTGIVLAGRRIRSADVRAGREPGTGHRLLILKPNGEVERVRLSDVSDVAPESVLTYDFSKGVDVKPETFLSWFAGDRATPGYEGREESSAALSTDPRSRTVQRRRAVLAGGATTADAEKEAKARAKRIRHDRMHSEDAEIEALAYLARPNDRRELEFGLDVEPSPKSPERARPSPEEVAERRTAPRERVRYFDPDAKIRTPEELQEAARGTDEQASKDFADYLWWKQRADKLRSDEALDEEKDQRTRRLGRGFAVVSGDIETDRRVLVRQQAVSPSGDFGEPKLLVAEQADEGTWHVRQLSTAEALTEQLNDPSLRTALEKFTKNRHAESMGRRTQAERTEVVAFAGERARQALEQIEAFLYGDGDLPGTGELFDMARSWLRANPAPKRGTPEFRAWEEEARGELAHFEGKAGEATISSRAFDLAMTFRDPVSGDALDLKDGVVVVASPKKEGVVVPVALPGVPPPGSWGHAKKVGRFFREAYIGTGRLVTDVSDAVVGSVVREVQRITTRPDQLGIGDTPFGRSSLYRKWVRGGRTFESKVIPSGDEHLGRVLTELNRYEGEESVYLERIEKALRSLSRMPHAEQLDLIRRYTEGDADPRMKVYDDLSREMLDELQRLKLLPEEAERFRGKHVSYTMFRWTAEEIAARRKDLSVERAKALRAGEDTRKFDEALDDLDDIVAKHSNSLGPTRVVIGPASLRQFGDPKVSRLLRSGMLRFRGFESFDDAVKAGLDTTNPTELLRRSVGIEAMAVARHRLFERLVADKRLVYDDKDKSAPSWYVKVDPLFTSKHAAWKKLDGKVVNPFLLDQLYAYDPGRTAASRWLDYFHGSLKMGRAMMDPSAITTNLIGNPLILAANGMPLHESYARYVQAFSQLLMTEPWMPEPIRSLGVKGRYGKKRADYMREGWVTHANDATRELQVALSQNRTLLDLLKKGSVEDMDHNESVLKAVQRVLAGSVRLLGDRGVRVYNLIDAAARAALHDFHVERGMGNEKSVEEVNKSFDVQHLPAFWRGIRKGVAGTGVLADSFVSFKVAMARNGRKFAASTPWVMAQAAGLSALIRHAVQSIYGMDDEEMDDIVDASLPRTGSRFLDGLNRKTALVIPWGEGPGVISMVRFTPHDAMADLVPGVRPFLFGGRDDKGRQPGDALLDYMGRSVLSGPYAEWMLDRDTLTGRPVRDRYEGMLDYVTKRQGLPVSGAPGGWLGPAAAFVSMLARKADDFDKAAGRDEPQYRTRAPVFISSKKGDRAPGATADRYSTSDAIARVFGLRVEPPNALRRAQEDALANNALVSQKDGDFIPNPGLGEEGRFQARETAAELNRTRDFERGIRLWAAVMDLKKLVSGGADEEEIANVKKAIAKMAPSDGSIRTVRMALGAFNEWGKANDLNVEMRRLGVYPTRERRIPRGVGGMLPSNK